MINKKDETVKGTTSTVENKIKQDVKIPKGPLAEKWARQRQLLQRNYLLSQHQIPEFAKHTRY